MKKLLFTLALVATSVVAMADRWTAPSPNTYSNATPLYVSVKIDEQADAYVPEITEIAAFIDGECRAQATQKMEVSDKEGNTHLLYVLNVRGDRAADPEYSDRGKEITIKALYKGLVYKFIQTETFDGEADTHDVPLELTLQPLLGISFPEQSINLTLNQTYNLADNLVYQYGESGAEVASEIDQTETPLTVTYKWDPKSEDGYINVSEQGVITPVAVTGQAYTAAMVTVEGPRDGSGYQPYFETRVTVNVTQPTVNGIVVTPTELDVYVGDNLQSLIREGKLKISMLPDEANQSYAWRTNEESLPWDGNYNFTAVGNYQVEVYSVDNPQVAQTVTFRVTLPPVDQIVVNPTELNVYVGDNLQTLIRTGALSISMLPVYADQNYGWTKVGERFPWNEDTFEFDAVGDYQVQVYSVANPNVTATVTFHVALPPVTEIVVNTTDLNVYVGNNLQTLISEGRLAISMQPALADQSYGWTKVGERFPWNEDTFEFDAVGDYQVQVYSVANPNLNPVTVTFHVALPPVTEIVVSPTELNVYVGDNLQALIRDGRLSISMLPAKADQGYRFSANTPSMPWDANYNFTSAGDYEVFVHSTGNNDLAPVTLTIHVLEPLSFTLEDGVNGGKIGMIQPLTFKVYPSTNEGFDPSLLTIESYHKTPIAPFTYEVSALKQEAVSGTGGAGRYYVIVTLTGRYLGTISYDVLYNGKTINADAQLTATVCPEISINEGWQWVSPYAFESGSEVGDICPNGRYIGWVNNLVEMRTQEGLFYVDDKLGAFGDITQFNFTEGMYKVKSKTSTVLRLGSEQNSWQLAQGTNISNGYNWVVYPYEFALTIVEASASLVGHEGDQIISKDGTFVEFSDGAWTPTDFTFQPGAGYMYYYTGTEDIPFSVNFNIYENTPACYSNVAPVRGEMGSLNKIDPVWTIDRSRFADNMTVVAEVEGLMNAEEWVLGAFVGDECRGEGRVVRDGIMFIGIAGKNGEKMNFRLHNLRTGEEFDVSETLSFHQKAGSLKAPLRLTSEGATGLVNVSVKEDLNDKAVYDLSGRRVERPTKGIYVRNGKKVLY